MNPCYKQCTKFLVQDVKVGLSTFKKCVFTYLNEISLKTMKDVFISCQKLFSFFSCLHFCPGLLVMQRNSFIKKLW